MKIEIRTIDSVATNFIAIKSEPGPHHMLFVTFESKDKDELRPIQLVMELIKKTMEDK